MNEDKEVTVTVTPEDIDFRNRAKAVGLPDTLISWYGTALRKLIADEREQCANVCDGYADNSSHPMNFANNCAAAIRART